MELMWSRGKLSWNKCSLYIFFLACLLLHWNYFCLLVLISGRLLTLHQHIYSGWQTVVRLIFWKKKIPLLVYRISLLSLSLFYKYPKLNMVSEHHAQPKL